MSSEDILLSLLFTLIIFSITSFKLIGAFIFDKIVGDYPTQYLPVQSW